MLKGVIHGSRLQADASRVEGDTLADKCKLLFILVGSSFIMTRRYVDLTQRKKIKKGGFTYISKNLAGSDVPWVTERKTF